MSLEKVSMYYLYERFNLIDNLGDVAQSIWKSSKSCKRPNEDGYPVFTGFKTITEARNWAIAVKYITEKKIKLHKNKRIVSMDFGIADHMNEYETSLIIEPLDLSTEIQNIHELDEIATKFNNNNPTLTISIIPNKEGYCQIILSQKTFLTPSTHYTVLTPSYSEINKIKQLLLECVEMSQINET